MSGMAVPLESQIKYLQRRAAELEQIQSTLATLPDWELIKKVGHQIKGNAATFGFAQLAEYGKALELAAGQSDAAYAQDVSEKLKQEVGTLLKSFAP